MDGACANKIFNPEHDQCLANGNCNYDPPQSSLRLSRDCAAIMDWLPPEGNRPAVQSVPLPTLLPYCRTSATRSRQNWRSSLTFVSTAASTRP